MAARVTALGVAVGVLLSGSLVLRGTSAAFTASTANPASSWTAGSVSLTDDDGGAALFAATDLLPSATGSNCLTVTYTSALAATVRLYASASTDTGASASYVDLVVEEGSGGGYGNCAGFTPTATIYSGTLASFNIRTTHATGVGIWAPTGTSSRIYRITYTVNASIPATRQGTSLSTTFAWEGRTT